jgi:glycerol-3-phosphate acyltransferase PlsX
MKIALDAMGGDFAPKAVVEGALLASTKVSSATQIILIGHTEEIQACLSTNQTLPDNVKIVHAEQQIEMGEHPLKALSNKPQSSISVGYSLLKKKEIDIFCSAGNTGAMLVGAMFSVKLDQVTRPAIMSYVPQLSGKKTVMLDVGANTDCKPETLNQFGEMGTVYYRHLFDVESPRVALINLGEEPSKGNLHSQAAYKLLEVNPKINFVGNIEGRDLFADKADVLVCDGYIGNVIIKMAESYYEILRDKEFFDPFFENFNIESVGGSPILGIDANVMIAHGISNAHTIKNLVFMAQQIAEAKIISKLKESLNN